LGILDRNKIMRKHLPGMLAGLAVLGIIIAIVSVVLMKPRPPEKTNGMPEAEEKQPAPPTAVPRPVVHAPASLAQGSALLYTGAEPRQVNVKPGAIEPKRAAILRGKVTDRQGQALAGVRIDVAHHPELGATQTGNDGRFDLVVNGGGQLCIDYRKDGFLPVCRTLTAPWQDYAWLPDVVLIQPDAKVTTVDLKADAPVQVARGSPVKDEHGQRQSTLLIPRGTAATMTLADGTKKDLTSLKVRATEFTVGKNGPAAMPAPLPPNSAYTYALDLSADEAAAGAGGANEVRFSKPLVHYVENFLEFPAGTPVPTGYFDAAKNAWIPAESGVVVEIVAVADGLAELSVAEKGTRADAAALAKLGITDAERRQLGTLYKPGQSLWRVPIPHFSLWDCNWGFSPPGDAEDPDADADDDDDDCQCDIPGGSVIGVQRQVLGESVPLAGAPLRLHYQSERTLGAKAARSVRIKLSGAKTPKSLKRIELEVQIAGQRFTKEDFPGKPEQSYRFVWDGKDGQGRPVAGGQWAVIKVGYVYDGVYERTARFGSNGNGAVITGSRTRQEVALWREFRTWIGGWDARSQGLGGWTLNVHHAYDVMGRTVHLGDGRRQGGGSGGVQPLNQGIVTVAGGGDGAGLGDGGPATKARLEDPARQQGAGTPRNRMLSYPWPVVVGAAGDFFLADENNRVRHVGVDGIIRTVAGGGTSDPAKGGKAVAARFANLVGLALAPDGTLFVSDFDQERVYRVAADGTLHTFAGTGKRGHAGDGGPAVNAQLSGPSALALGTDGSLYIADTNNHRIRRVGPDGVISTVAGDPAKDRDSWKEGYAGDGGPAAKAKLYWPNALAVAPDGSLFVCDMGNYVIRRISPTGIITTVAGTKLPDFSSEFAGDGGPAFKAKFYDPAAICLGRDGALLVADTRNHRIRRIGLDGIVTTLAGVPGKGDHGDVAGDGGSASQAKFSYPAGIACGPDGSVYVFDATRYISGGQGRSKTIRHRIRRIAPALPGFTNNQIAIPSEDGRELFKFDATGRHLETREARTGALVLRFHYDAKDRLDKVEDAFGNACALERDAHGNPRAVIAPNGQRTVFEVDEHGYLAKITRPGEPAIELASTPGGLLKTFQDGGGAVAKFDYDELGRLTKDESADGGRFTLERRELSKGFEVSLSTALKPPTNYRTVTLPGGGVESVNQCCCGAETVVRVEADGAVKTVFPDGTIKSRLEQPDSRWGMMGRNLHKTALTTPAGRTATAVLESATILADKSNPLSLKTQTTMLTLNGRKFTRTYEAAARTLTQTTPSGRNTVTTLDEHGRTVKVQVADLAPVRLGYDARGRLSELSQGDGPAGRRLTIDYDDAGRVAAVTDPLKRTTKIHYDKSGRADKQVLPDGREIGFAFDARGNLLRVTPPGKPAHAFDYTPTGRLKLYEPPAVGADKSKTGYEYNQDGKLTRVLRAHAEPIALDYDKVGHLETVETPARKWKLAFDGKTEQLKSIAGPDGALEFAYDGFLVTGTKWDGAIKGATGREFDNNFRVAARTLNGGSTVKFEYDPDGLLTKAGALKLQRDPKSGLVRGTTLGRVETALDYSSFGERAKFTAKVGGKDLFSVAYERDTLGRVTKKTETLQGKTEVYGYDYDRAGRLTDVTKNGAKVAHYEYDANDNRVKYEGPLGSFAGSYDAQDRVSNYGPLSFTHAPAGPWLTRTEAGKTTRFDYDVFGNLRAVAGPDGPTIEYLVDPGQRRIGKKVNGKLVQGFLWQDQLKPAAELDGAGNVVSRFIYAGGVNVPSYLEKAGKTYRIITDQLGSPRLVIDAASGDIAQRLDYDEFGNVLLDSNPGFQPFGFAGGLYDHQTKLVRFGARDYDAWTGRWTAPDPILFGGGAPNLYSFVMSDPVNNQDPLGLDAQKTLGAVGTVVGAGVSFGKVSIVTGGTATALGLETGGAVVVGVGGTAQAPVVYSLAVGAGQTSATFFGVSVAGVVASGYLGYQVGSVTASPLFDATYTWAFGQTLGEDYADMPFDPSGRGRSFGEWWRCLGSDASGCSSCCP